MNNRVLSIAWRLVAAAVLAVATGVTYLVLVRTEAGQEADQRILETFDPSFTRASGEVPLPLEVPVPVLFTIALALVVVIGLVRRAYLRTVAAVGLMAVTAGVAQLLKAALDRPGLAEEIHSTSNSFPSGHVSVAAMSVFALLLVVPRLARFAVAPLGLAWIVAVGVSTLTVGWHRPSDCLGGFLLAATGYALASAFVVARPPRPADGPTVVLGVPATQPIPYVDRRQFSAPR
ncbi:phosphatase PAP2 family protein [Amycolatopsis sp. NPDC051903]|uniref:phosphatase PAP2 family protein n=1 Tax=Amycolatopsis sp. NPDC051903 TaxID=3363936 RepID=UPI00379CD21A